MTRAYFQEIATEAFVLSGSAMFLAWYILAKVSVWPWGACSY
jgi:hypothetical protein